MKTRETDPTKRALRKGDSELGFSLFLRPGLICCLLAYFQQAIGRCGCHLIRPSQHVVRLINHILTGADFVPGFTVGRALRIEHPAGIVIGKGAVIGDRVTLLHGVTLGQAQIVGGGEYPTLGNDVKVGAHAVLLGDIMIGAGSIVGAGAVVLESFPPGSTIVGVPAKRQVPGDG